MHHAHIDKFAYQNSPVHNLDSRVKFITTLVFTIIVISLSPTSLSILSCYAVGPFAILVIGRIPLKFALKQIVIVSPFILVLALSCPLYDSTAVSVDFGLLTWHTSQGWVRCFSILGKFAVTMLALIALVSTTRFSELLVGLRKLGMPKLLTVQLGFLYRYIFILIDQAHHMLRARAGRKLRNLGFKKESAIVASMLGALLVRSIDTAENIGMAMQARGFDGNWRVLSEMRIRRSDLFFTILAAIFIFIIHFLINPALQ